MAGMEVTKVHNAKFANCSELRHPHPVHHSLNTAGSSVQQFCSTSISLLFCLEMAICRGLPYGLHYN